MLDSAPIATLEQHLKRWAERRRSCAPVDRTHIEAAIHLAYRAAGVAPPVRIAWCEGPIEIAKQLASAKSSDHIGSNVRQRIFDAPRDRAKMFAEIFWKELVIAATEGPSSISIDAARRSLERAKMLGTSIDNAISDAALENLDQISVRLRHGLGRWRGLPRLLPYARFSELAISPEELASLELFEYLREVVDWEDQIKPLAGLMTMAQSGCWLVPHEQTCWVCDRPDRLLTDTADRLHCANGPALTYHDGWRAYFWKGVQVQPWMIEHPEQITIAKIARTFEPTLRATMIDIMTPERFIRTGGASRISHDDTGSLWRQTWTFERVPIGSWCAVEVENGTPEPDGTHKTYVLRVPPECQTAREAVAWTYGMTAEQYARLEQRT
jgi:hypothetical protein